MDSSIKKLAIGVGLGIALASVLSMAIKWAMAKIQTATATK